MSILRDYSRLDKFLRDREQDIGATFFDAIHIEISKQIITILDSWGLVKGKKILDIGCGTGRDLVRFTQLGGHPVGITANVQDKLLRQRIRNHNLEVYEMDQNFINLPEAAFDLGFARHVLEHSVIPFFTLTEYNRVLAPGATLYVEVPAPINRELATERWVTWLSEDNQNHYSVLGKDMWLALFRRSGFTLRQDTMMNFEDEDTGKLQEQWMGFFLQKTSEPLKPFIRDTEGVEMSVGSCYELEEKLENEDN